MFLNISNHPSAGWSEEQLSRAKELGTVIVDIKFPNVPPEALENEVAAMAKALVGNLPYPIANADDWVLVQGEQSLCYELSRRLLALGWHVCVATSERVVVEEEGGKKTSLFKFVQFRPLRS